MKVINWGILGCGDVSEVKSGPAFSLLDNSRLVAVMRRDGAKAADYAKRHNVPKWYDKADDLINDDEVNAVYIATPPSSHAELAIKAMQAGKFVYVEKPMATTFAECIEMLSVSEKTGMQLRVAYYRRALPGFLKVKELIEGNAIGKVKLVKMDLIKSMPTQFTKNDLPWRVIPEIAGGGHFYDLASHQLDFIQFLLGEITEVNGIAKNQAEAYRAEDIVSANYLLKNGTIVNGNWCFTLPDFLDKDNIEIMGEKGSISLSCFNFTPIILKTINNKTQFDFDKPTHVQLPFIHEVVDEFLKGIENGNGVSAARTNWALEETVKSYYKTHNPK